jgi:hypothetical protein
MSTTSFVGKAGIVAPLSGAYQMIHLMNMRYFTGNPAYSIRAYSYRGCLVTFWAQSVSAGSASVGVM